METWRDVPGWEGLYQVSDLGRIKSFHLVGGQLMRPQAQKSGHLSVGFRNKGPKIMRRVHRLVMEAFVGPCPTGCEVRHLNGDPRDNRLLNLAYGTSSQNRRDTYEHGTRPTGERSHLARKSDEEIARLKALKGVVSSSEAGRMFGLCRSYVSEIWRGEARARG